MQLSTEESAKILGPNILENVNNHFWFRNIMNNQPDDVVIGYKKKLEVLLQNIQNEALIKSNIDIRIRTKEKVDDFFTKTHRISKGCTGKVQEILKEYYLFSATT